MEKSSEKCIRTPLPKRNPFNDMLSEIHLTLPNNHIRNKKNPQNLVLQYDPYIDRNSYKQIEQREAKTPKFKPRIEEQPTVFHPQPPQPQPTKESSIVSHQKSRSELLNQWVLEYMERKDLLGTKWQITLGTRKREVLEWAFGLIKSTRLEGHYTFRPFSWMEAKKLELLVDCIGYIEQQRKKSVIEQILHYSREISLFGLSNTIDPKEQADPMQIPPPMQIKQPGSDSKKAIDGKTEDLSNLILNQAKLNIQENPSLPNIPRALKNSQNKLSTARDLGDLALSTRKKINSIKKLQQGELPLDSNKNLPQIKPIKTKNNIVQKESEKLDTPITITYILKDLDLNNICLSPDPSQKSIPEVFQNNRKQQKQSTQVDFINKAPISQSFYQPANKQAQIRNPLINSQQEQVKRSISMNLPPCGRLHSPERASQHVTQFKFNQYYPHPQDGSCRVGHKNIRPSLRQEKPRAHSATPKIKFTFTSSQVSTNSQSSNHKLSPNYENQDCIKEASSIIQHNKGSINSLPRESKVRNSKVFCQQRQHIKDMLLPSPYEQYYQIEHSHQHKQVNRVPMLSSSQSSSQAELGLHSYQRQHGIVSPTRAKSPRDKLLVTCSSRNKL